MKILLDTNIVVYRESDNSSKDGLGELYRLIDNNIQMQKYINPTIKSEILQKLSGNKRDIMINRLESYNMLENSSKYICDELKEKFGERDKLQNDINDSLILTDIFTGKADLLITDDKRIKRKANELGIAPKVNNIGEFLYNCKAEKKVPHDILDIHKRKLSNVDITDIFFDSLKKSYPGFEEWFKRKKDEEAYCYYEGTKLQGLLLLKNEEIGEDYSDISPTMRINRKLKVSTFKVDVKGKKIGERFIKIIFDQAIYSNVNEIYVTIFDDDYNKLNLIKYFEKFGFIYHGKKNGKELVYIRNMNKKFIKEKPLTSYPYFSRKSDSFIIPIKPSYHTFLLPDSKLSKELYKNIHMPVEYAITKYYISAAGWNTKPKIGDNIVFYRSKDSIIPAKYSSVITTIGIVNNIYNPQNINDLVNIVKDKTVYTNEEIINWYKNKIHNTYVIEFAYITTLGNKITFNDCLNNGILTEAPIGVSQLSQEGFNKIVELGNVDMTIVI